jgi:hypothetical protein
MLNQRGAAIVALVATAALAAYGIGKAKERTAWSSWTFESVAFDTKGDRQK